MREIIRRLLRPGEKAPAFTKHIADVIPKLSKKQWQWAQRIAAKRK